jgi:hypothetical protein
MKLISFFSIDEHVFKKMQDNQRLLIHFKDFSNMLKKLFNDCINEPNV